MKKLKALAKQEEHLYHAESSKNYYKRQCIEAKKELSLVNREISRKQFVPACATQITIHISFDFAQQLHYPTDPLQPGPIYFATPRKCGIFGISSEALSKQINYLIDESVSTGKGPNTIISYVHHYLQKYGLGATNLHVHADNCVGQNKNNPFLYYFVWRILTGRHQAIEYSFMEVGHTKFACDAGFGMIKKVTKRTFIS